MSDLIRREDALQAIKDSDFGKEYDEVEKVPAVAATRWHRVEEPPKKTAKYLVWVDVNNGVFAAYPELRTASYNVVYERWYVDGDQRTEWIGTPRYWMPIEPPKEDA